MIKLSRTVKFLTTGSSYRDSTVYNGLKRTPPYNGHYSLEQNGLIIQVKHLQEDLYKADTSIRRTLFLGTERTDYSG